MSEKILRGQDLMRSRGRAEYIRLKILLAIQVSKILNNKQKLYSLHIFSQSLIKKLRRKRSRTRIRNQKQVLVVLRRDAEQFRKLREIKGVVKRRIGIWEINFLFKIFNNDNCRKFFKCQVLPSYLYQQKILKMNIFNTTLPTSSNSVFIETDNFERIQTMKELVARGSILDIQKHFFAGGDLGNLDIQKLTSIQINKHQQSLSYRNKTLLKTLLKSNHQGDLDQTDLKMLHESGTSSPSIHEDVNQYLTFDEEIDFGTFYVKK